MSTLVASWIFRHSSWSGVWQAHAAAASRPRYSSCLSTLASTPQQFTLSKRAFRISWTIAKYACIFYCVNAYLIDYFVCIGPSMEPTIRSHDVVLTEHLTQRFGELKIGDLVVARSPVNPTLFVCKRIVAKGGDVMLNENTDIVRIPRGQLWLQGDNPDNSVDSRKYGPVPEALVQTRIFARIWPPSRFGILFGTMKNSSIEEMEDP